MLSLRVAGTDAELVIWEQSGAVLFDVRVSPRAAREKLLGTHAGALKLSLSAPPVDGAANEALIAMLAAALAVPRAAVSIVRGQHSRNKRVRVHGVNAEAVRALLPSPDPNLPDKESGCPKAYRREK